MLRNTCCHFYLAENIDTTNHSHFIGVIDEADISLCSSIELPNMNASETVQELFPDVCSYTITNGDLHLVVSVIVFLRSGNTEQPSLWFNLCTASKLSNTIALSKTKGVEFEHFTYVPEHTNSAPIHWKFLPVAQRVQHDANNTKDMSSIPRECTDKMHYIPWKSLWIKASAEFMSVNVGNSIRD